MTVNDLVGKIDGVAVNIGNGERMVMSGYCGDFLSFVMGKAPADSVWFTVMTNINVAAVAALADVAAVVICEGSKCEPALAERAAERNINIIETDLDIFGAVLTLFGK